MRYLLPIVLVLSLVACGGASDQDGTELHHEVPMSELPTTEEGWRKRLSPEEFRVLRHEGTERAFSGAYYNAKQAGIYRCAGCGQPLFSSEHKYDSGTGWPSFWKPIDDAAIERRDDTSHGMVRTEVHCSRCGGHQGHVFEDGPEPTGLRYCINSVSLNFDPAENE